MLLSSLLFIADVVQSLSPDDDFSPAVFLIVICFFAVCLVLLGIGVAIGLICVAGAAAVVALGILSSSALVAMWQQRFSAGFRAPHYQLCAAAALPGGVCLLWLGSVFFAVHLRHRYILLIGALAGGVAGLLLTVVLDWFGRFACRRLLFTLWPILPVPAVPIDLQSSKDRP